MTLPVSWESCMWVKKQQLESDMKQLTGSKLRKEYIKAVYCHPAYLTYIQSTWCELPGRMNHKLESRLPGEISTTSDMQMIDDTTLRQKAKRNWRSPDESERGEWKSWLKIQHSKNWDHASSPITSWQIDGEKVEAVTGFIFLGSKIIVDIDCSREIKTLVPWMESCDKPR